MARIPEEKTYASSGISAAFGVGKALQGIKKKPTMPRLPNIKAPSTSAPAGTKLPLGTVTTPFMGSTKFEPSGAHKGIDIGAKFQTPISAYTGGTVTDVRSGMKQGDKGFGNFVIVTDEKGNKHRYSHLNQSYVPIGSTIKRGQNIGLMGRSGSVYSQWEGGDPSHLDYRIRDAYGRYVNPLSFIKRFL